MLRFDEYEAHAERTKKEDMTLVDLALGVAGESGEIADAVKKYVFHGHELDTSKIQEELGDLLWYVAMMATRSGASLEEIALRNITKLSERYPEGFSQEASIRRAR